jgi:hypothetical protein
MKSAIALLAISLAGCGLFKKAEHPRHTLRASVLGVAYATKALDGVCADTARTLGGARGAELAGTCARAYRVARESLLSAEAGLDAWTAADQRLVGCFAAKGARALLEGVHAAKAAGATLPNAVADGAQLAEILVPIAEGACPK